MTLDETVKFLATTTMPLDLAVRGCQIDADEVAQALAKAKPDTAEFLCLSLLAKANPVPPKPAKPSKG